MRVTTLRELLREALTSDLSGWLYLPNTSELALDTQCLLVPDDLEGPTTDSGVPVVAVELGFPNPVLDAETICDTAQRAGDFERRPSDELLFESFRYYLRHDAFLPAPGAKAPPPWEETQRKRDREYYDSLGAERAQVRCRRTGCERGAVEQSVLCRPHHFESVKGRICPFDD